MGIKGRQTIFQFMNDRIKFEPYELIADSLITALLSKIQSTNAYFLAAKERDGDARSFWR